MSWFLEKWACLPPGSNRQRQMCEDIDYPQDEEAFDCAVERCKKIFLKRKKRHGNFIDNCKKFSKYTTVGILEKCFRTIIDDEHGKEISEDTLIDLANYSIMEIARRFCETPL